MTTELVQYMKSDLVQGNFADVLGERGGKAYVASVLLAVANNPGLQKCDPRSIYISALRAATLRLSVDPSLGHAYLVPFGNKCTFVVGKKGLHDLAVRTNKYRYINVFPIYDGQVVVEAPHSGWHSWEGAPKDKKDESIIGWMGAFELVSGYAKTVYMTIEEIHKHAQKFSRSYTSADGAWKQHTRAMESKTVLKQLLSKWGVMNPDDQAVLDQIDEREPGEYMNGDYSQIPEHIEDNAKPADSETYPSHEAQPGLIQQIVDAVKPKRTAEELNKELGYDPDGRKRAPQSKDDEASYFAFTDTLMTRAHAEKILDEVGGDCFQAYNAVLRMGKPVAAK